MLAFRALRQFAVPLIGFSITILLGLSVFAVLLLNKRTTENRSKAASDGVYEVKLVNRTVGANIYFLFDGIAENGLTTQQGDTSRFTYSGAGWVKNAALSWTNGGSASYTGTAGDAVTFTTTANQVTIHTYKSTTSYGAFDVYIDGKLQQTVMVNTTTGGLASIVVQVIPPVGSKFVQLVNRPTTPTMNGFIFDGISEGTVITQQDNTTKFFYTGTAWAPLASTAANGGSAIYTAQADASIGFYTTASQVTAYVYKDSAWAGNFDLYVDGKFKQTISLSATTATWNVAVLLDVSPPVSPPAGSKLIKIVNRHVGTNTNFLMDGIKENGSTIEQADNRFWYSGGGWFRNFTSSTLPSGGSAFYTSTAGDSVSFYSNASSINLITYKGPGYGAFDVYVDGRLQQTIKVTATAGVWKSEVTISLATPPAGSKFVQILNRPIGTNGTFIFDGVVIGNTTLQENDPQVFYTGVGWYPYANTALNGGNSNYTVTAGEGIGFYTTATDFSILAYKASVGAGAFDVFVDGQFKQTVILFSPSTIFSGRHDISLSSPPAGSKLVKLVNKGVGTSVYMMFDGITESGIVTQEMDSKKVLLAGTGWVPFASTAVNGGTALYTGTVGDSVSFYTTASESTILAYKGAGYGAFDVYIDGQYKQTVFTTTTATVGTYQAPFTITHTIASGAKLVKLVNKPVGANVYFMFDGIVENDTTLQQNDKRFMYGGASWMGEYVIASANGGSAAYTSIANDSISFYTTASSVSIITLKSPSSYGSFDVYVDGVFKQNVLLSATATSWNVQIPIQISGVASTPTPTPTAVPMPTPTVTPGGGQSFTTKPLNVLELRYYTSPTNNAGYVTYHNAVSQSLQTKLENASKYHGYKDASAQPLLDVIVKATVSRYKQFPNVGNDPVASVKAAVADTDGGNICNLITTHQIDQIWLYFTEGDTGAFHDVSSTFHYKIGPDSLCNGARSVAVLNSLHAHDNYPIRPAQDVSLHVFGHFAESQLTGLQTPELFINQFTGSEYVSNTLMRDVGLGHSTVCGNVHWAPNTPIDQGYVMWSTNVANNNNCEDWRPNGGGVKNSVTCSNWNACPVNTTKTLDFLEWWFNNMPGKSTTITYNGKNIPPWLDFFADTDATMEYYGRRSDLWHINTPFLYSLSPSLTLPIAINSFSSAKSDTTAGLSWTHTSSSVANRLLVVVIGYGSDLSGANAGRIQSVTYNGVGLTQARKDYNNLNTEIWFLPNPATSGTVQVSYGGTIYNSIGTAMTIGGVDLTNPVKKNADNITYGIGTGNPNSPRGAGNHSLTVPSQAGDLVIGAYASYGPGNDVTPGSTTQLITNEKNASSVLFMGMQKVTGTTGTISWTNTDDWFWSASGISINLQ